MGVDGDLLAVEMRGLDDRARLVLEHLRAEAEADAAVDAAGGGDLDHVDAARDLAAHRAAAIVGAVAGAARLAQRRRGIPRACRASASMWPVVAEMRGAGVDDARADRPAARDRVAQAEGDAVVGAEVADRGEAGVERLAGVPGRLVGAQRRRCRSRRRAGPRPRPGRMSRWTWLSIRPGSTKRSRKVDQPRAGGRRRRSRPAPPRSGRRGR